MNDHSAYGFDSEDRLIVHHDGALAAYRGDHWDTLYVYSEDLVEEFVFASASESHPDGHTVSCSRLHMEHGRAALRISLGQVLGVTEYAWDGADLAHARTWRAESADSGLCLGNEYFPVYEGSALVRVDMIQRWDGRTSRRTLWPRPEPAHARAEEAEVSFDLRAVRAAVAEVGDDGRIEWVRDRGTYLLVRAGDRRRVIEPTDAITDLDVLGFDDFAFDVTDEVRGSTGERVAIRCIILVRDEDRELASFSVTSS